MLKTARYLRKIRLDRQWKQEYVAAKLNISRTLLSEIELGHTPINEELKQSLISLYQLQSLESEELLELKLTDLFLAVYNCDEEAISLYNELTGNKLNYTNSSLFIEYWLVMFIYTVTYKLDCSIYYQNLKHYNRFLIDKEQQYFSLFKAIQLRNEFRDRKAMDIIQQLLNLDVKDLHFESLLNYHAAYLYYGLGDYTNSLCCVFKASQGFKDTICPVRYFRTESQAANIYMATHLYSQADTINRKLIKDAKGKLPDYDYDCIISNAALNMIYTLNYTAALRYLQKKTAHWTAVPQMFFNIAWIFYKLNCKEDALEIIEKYRDDIYDQYIQDMLQIIYFLIEDPDNKELLALLKKCEKYLNKTGDVDAIIFIYNLMLEFYERKNNTMQQIKVMKKILEIEKLSYKNSLL
ncbi:helix-turn-helix domain-containing protein [Holdemania filiformis]|uniref:helix-turn-helix domain-containing protein n=1 Tax=Holdemania filiformis TaxID=61171 RepID=UPI002432403D|nr:helix-turn-helix transcriptional regulator [Holdemania filiformis]